MPGRRLLCPALAVAAVLPAVLAAPALGATCASSAEIVSGKLVRPAYSDPVENPDGTVSPPARDPSKDVPIHRLTRMPAEVVSATATVRVQHVTYRLTRHTALRLTCFGESRAEGAIFPSLAIDRGGATVTAPAGHPGAVMTSQALVNPFARAGQTFRVRLTGTNDQNVEQGTTVVRKLSGAGMVNVTPYVGPRQGSCRQVHSARLSSPDADHPHGAALYDGRPG